MPVASIILSIANPCRAQENLTSRPVTIIFKQISVARALDQLHRISGVAIAYETDILPAGKIVPKKIASQTLGQALDHILSGTGLHYEVVAGTIVINRTNSDFNNLNGIVYDLETGENLIGATLEMGGEKIFSNQYGYFSMAATAGSYAVSVSFVGYEISRQQIRLDRDVYQPIGLTKKAMQLEMVNISDGIPSRDSIDMARSFKKLPISELGSRPYFAGEVDLIKALQMQVGIKNPSEGSSGLSVRGSNYDQNLILVDEAPVYNPSHLFGLVSIFNIDAVKSMELYQDYMPANFGGRLSSVIDTKLGEGDMSSYHFKGGASLLSARLTAEGPLVRNKSSFLFSARRSLTDLYNTDFGYFNVNANYYDFNLKANYIFNRKTRVYLSFYHGFDHLYAPYDYANDWTNTTSTLRLNHVYSPRLFVNFSAIFSNYRSALSLDNTMLTNKEWLTGIRDLTLKADFTYYQKPKNHIKFGVAGTRHHFRPGETQLDDKSISLNRISALEYTLYYDQDFYLSKLIQLRVGLRAGVFSHTEQTTKNFYGSPTNFYGVEPRLQLNIKFANDQLLKFSYNRNVQYLQLLQNNEQSFSTIDTWIPAGPRVKPQASDFLSSSFGYIKNSRASAELSVYYRRSYRQLEMADHSQVISNPAYQDALRFGNATAFGAEFSLNNRMGRLSSSLSYSYSRTFRKISGINDGQRYPANYDVPNDLKISVSYRLGRRLTFSSIFAYRSGRAVTLPVGHYMENASRVPIFESRNSSRFPDFSRLDFVAEISPRRKSAVLAGKHWGSTWNFGIYNVYNRKNPLFYRTSLDAGQKNIGFEEAFSGIIPTISYSFKF